MGPIARFSFYISAVSNLFLARTKDQKIFAREADNDEDPVLAENKEKDTKISQTMHKTLQNKYAKHQIVRMSMMDVTRLFMMNLLDLLPCCESCFTKSSKNKKLWTLFTQGRKRIEDRLNVYDNLRSIENMRIFYDDKLLTD